MKVADVVNNWLWCWTKVGGKYHYFNNKKRSLCGKHRHPKTQPVEYMIWTQGGNECYRCTTIKKGKDAKAQEATARRWSRSVLEPPGNRRGAKTRRASKGRKRKA